MLRFSRKGLLKEKLVSVKIKDDTKTVWNKKVEHDFNELQEELEYNMKVCAVIENA